MINVVGFCYVLHFDGVFVLKYICQSISAITLLSELGTVFSFGVCCAWRFPCCTKTWSCYYHVVHMIYMEWNSQIHVLSTLLVLFGSCDLWASMDKNVYFYLWVKVLRSCIGLLYLVGVLWIGKNIAIKGSHPKGPSKSRLQAALESSYNEGCHIYVLSSLW